MNPVANNCDQLAGRELISPEHLEGRIVTFREGWKESQAALRAAAAEIRRQERLLDEARETIERLSSQPTCPVGPFRRWLRKFGLR